jgi:hypothetical protein
MPAPPESVISARNFSAEQRRALQFLANSPFGPVN